MGIDRGFKGTIPQGRSALYPQYRGVWEPVPYDIADFVLHAGGVYVANGATTSKDIPGTSPIWSIVLTDGGLGTQLQNNIAAGNVLISHMRELENQALQALNENLKENVKIKADWEEIKAETAHTQAVVEAMGAEALVRAGTDHTIPSSAYLGTLPQTTIGATAYAIAEREHYQLQEGLGWVKLGPGLPAASEVTATVADLVALRAYTGPASTVIVSDSLTGGVFIRNPNISHDDGGNSIIGVAGWERTGRVYNIEHYGGRAAYGLHDNTPAFNAILQAIGKNGGYSAAVFFPAAKADYYFNTQTDPISDVNIVFYGENEDVTRLVGNYPGPLFLMEARPAGTRHSDDPGNTPSGIRFLKMTVKHPYSADPRYWRPTGGPNGAPRKGLTLDPAFAAAHPDKYEMATPNPQNMEQWVLFNAKQVSNWTLQDIKIDGCYQVAWFGSSTTYSSAFAWENVRGWTFNRGLAAVTVYQGAGFSGNIPSFFTQAEHPAMEEVTINGKPHYFIETMTTLPGTNLFNIRGHWDTWGIGGRNATFERFWSLYNINVTLGHAFSFIEHQGVITDYFAGDVLDFEGNQGSVSLFSAGDMRASPVQGRFVNLPVNSGYVELDLEAASCYMAGREIIRLENQNMIDFQLNAGRFHSSNFLNAAIPYTHPETLAPGFAIELDAPGGRIKNPTGGAFNIGAGVKRFRISNADINRDTPYAGTMPWYAAYGIIIGPDCDDFSITDCVIGGQYLGVAQPTPNSGPSTQRKISGVRSKNLLELGTDAFLLPAIGASGETYWNTTPFTLSVSIGGGVVTGIEYRVVNGIPSTNRPTGRISGEFILQPGEGLKLDFTSTPTLIPRIIV